MLFMKLAMKILFDFYLRKLLVDYIQVTSEAYGDGFTGTAIWFYFVFLVQMELALSIKDDNKVLI